MLEEFVRTRPTTMEEFRARLPLSLRQDTDSRHVRYLPDIFALIDGPVR
jgi:hypothetical protein